VDEPLHESELQQTLQLLHDNLDAGLHQLHHYAQQGSGIAHAILGDLYSQYTTKYYLPLDESHPTHTGHEDRVAYEHDEYARSGSELVTLARWPELDLLAALHHYNMSAQRGVSHAQRMYAFMLEHYARVPEHVPAALVHLEFAAQSRDIEALLALGHKHDAGLNVVRTCTRAVAYYQHAAKLIVEATQAGPHVRVMSDYVRLNDERDKGRSRAVEEADTLEFYTYAADNGEVDAQVALGLLYLQGGLGLARDPDMALYYMRLAAEQEDGNALAHLGWMLARGVGSEHEDPVTALHLLQQSSEANSGHGHTYLALMHLQGRAVKQNVKEAHRLLLKAAELNTAEALLQLGLLHYYGVPSLHYPTRDAYVIARDYAKSFGYFQRAAQAGHTVALYWLGVMHLHGLGTGAAANCPHALLLFKKLIERTYLHELGQQIYYRLVVPGHDHAALLNYLRAASLGHEAAVMNAAYLFETIETGDLATSLGSATADSVLQALHVNVSAEERQRKAFKLYSIAAAQNNAVAYLKLGDFYYYGKGQAIDHVRAAGMYQAASALNLAQASFNLGWMHQKGIGLPRDLHLAKRFYDLASEQNAKEAHVPVALAYVSLALDYVLYETTIGARWDNYAIMALAVLLLVLLMLRRALTAQ
jgi:SEL1 protein